MAVTAQRRRRSVVRPGLLVVLGGFALSVTVHLALASGANSVRVPDVIGLPLDRAQHQLDGLGLDVDTDSATQAPLQPQDWTVVAQSATPGSAVADGARVVLSVDLTPLGGGEPAPSSEDRVDDPTALTPPDPDAPAGDRPLGWVQQHYRGVDWLAVLVGTEPQGTQLRVHTGLPYAVGADVTAEAVCNAFAAYQILELDGLRGVVVLAGGGQPLAARPATEPSCAGSLG